MTHGAGRAGCCAASSRQLPRWLGQRRNNGPPRTCPAACRSCRSPTGRTTRRSPPTARAWRSTSSARRSPRRAGSARSACVVADLDARRAAARGQPRRAACAPGRPRSGYHSALSADGRSVTFEVAEGNMNYAKRYGQMRVVLRDLRARRTRRLSHPRGSAAARRGPPTTRRCPGDGRFVAFEAADASRRRARRPRCGSSTGGPARRRSSAAAARARSTRRGSRATAARSSFSAADAGTDGRALVFVRDVATGATTLVSRAPGADGASADDDAYEPSISADGRFVAFTSAAGNLGARGQPLAHLGPRPRRRARSRP